MRNKKFKDAAICFSGLVKNFDLCYPYIKKNLLDNLKDYDVFCCVEDDVNAPQIEVLHPAKIQKIKSSEVDGIIKPELKKLHKENYKKLFFLETSKFNLRNTYQQIYKLKEVCNSLENYMKENNVSYRYFIRIRFDFLPINPISPDRLNIKKGEIVVHHMEKGPEKDQINDMFCISSDFESFRTYCSVYDNFSRIATNEIPFNLSHTQKFHFSFERLYVYLSLFLFGRRNKIFKNILGFLLLLPKKFYKTLKNSFRVCLERVMYYYLKSEKKIIREEKIPFAIVRTPMDGLLFL